MSLKYKKIVQVLKGGKMLVYAITLKNMGRDGNGLPRYVWATETQVKRLVALRNNPEKRSGFIKIGKFIFSPMDISHIEEKDTDNYGGPIPKYVKDKLGDEQKNYTLPTGGKFIENV
jgi:hypothetical protein